VARELFDLSVGKHSAVAHLRPASLPDQRIVELPGVQTGDWVSVSLPKVVLARRKKSFKNEQE
jgi:hypothetical protein